MKRVVVLGATAAIAQAVLREWCGRGWDFYLLGRSAEKLEAVRKDLEIRNVRPVQACVADLAAGQDFQGVWSETVKALGGVDLVFIAYGALGDADNMAVDSDAAVRNLEENFISVVRWLTLAAQDLEKQGSGQIVVISSVAGDRGRASNLVYGAGKGALTIYLSGLRQRLLRKGINVLTVKPGFVDTPMTADFKKGILFATPESVAKDIVQAVDRRADVIYTPCWWWIIMTVIRILPEAIFKRLKF